MQKEMQKERPDVTDFQSRNGIWANFMLVFLAFFCLHLTLIALQLIIAVCFCTGVRFPDTWFAYIMPSSSKYEQMIVVFADAQKTWRTL